MGVSEHWPDPEGLRASAEDCDRAGLIGAAHLLRAAADYIETRPAQPRGAVSADVIAAGDALADAVSDIMASDPESVLHTWARRWREARPSADLEPANPRCAKSGLT